jgi:hypothetical protein
MRRTPPPQRQRDAMTKTPIVPANGEHMIVYAYPSSPLADSLGAKLGTYVVTIAGADVAMPTYNAAVDHIADKGTKPSRWSLDHSENARFL